MCCPVCLLRTNSTAILTFCIFKSDTWHWTYVIKFDGKCSCNQNILSQGKLFFNAGAVFKICFIQWNYRKRGGINHFVTWFLKKIYISARHWTEVLGHFLNSNCVLHRMKLQLRIALECVPVMFRFSACAGTDMEDCIAVDDHLMPRFSEPLSFTTDHSYTLSHIMRQGDHITDLRPFTPNPPLSVHRFTIPLLEMKPTPEKSKTMISHYTTMSLITEQAKLQQNQIKESVFSAVLSSYMIQWEVEVLFLLLLLPFFFFFFFSR